MASSLPTAGLPIQITDAPRLVMSWSHGSRTLVSYWVRHVGSVDAAPSPVRSTSDSQVPTNITMISGFSSSSCWFHVNRTVGSRSTLGVSTKRTCEVPSASSAALRAGARPAMTESPASTIRSGSAAVGRRGPGSVVVVVGAGVVGGWVVVASVAAGAAVVVDVDELVEGAVATSSPLPFADAPTE